MGQELSNEKKFDSLACLLLEFYSFEKSGSHSLYYTEKKTSTLRVMLWEHGCPRVYNATEQLALLPRYIENREISQERLDGFSISLAQKKRNSKIQMSE